MNWLHTWAGVVFGGVLFAIFWMGTLSVFDREIDRWMAPMLRQSLHAHSSASLDVLRPSYELAVAAGSPGWTVFLPVERVPALRVVWREGPVLVDRFFDALTGASLPDGGTLGGSRFIYPFHYMLHIRTYDLGSWIVGMAGMTMLVLCVSGVAIHRRIFADFFMLRVLKKPRRLMLDVHNVVGVLGLPFHFVISLSGLIIFCSFYFPGVWEVAYKGDERAFNLEAYGAIRISKAGQPGGAVSLDGMLAAAQRVWGGGSASYVQVRNPGDAAAIVQIVRRDEHGVGGTSDAVYFSSVTGVKIAERVGARPMVGIEQFVSGLHMIQFRHWTLRWIYFGLGLTGCALIATGYLFWLESRRRKHAQLGLRGVRIVEALTIGSVSGIVAATLSFFAINRLLPLGSSFAGYDRAALEVWTFYLVWLAAFAHAWARPARAWIEQCSVIAVLALLAVALNWITTGDHLARSVLHHHLWPIAGMDFLLLAGAAIAGLTAHRLRGIRSGPGVSSARRPAGR